MDKAGSFSDRFSQVGGEGDNIVVGRLLDFVDALDRELRAALDLLQRVTGNRAHLGVNFADRDLHVQPFLKFGLLRPERAHFGQGVAIDHRVLWSTDLRRFHRFKD